MLRVRLALLPNDCSRPPQARSVCAVLVSFFLVFSLYHTTAAEPGSGSAAASPLPAYGERLGEPAAGPADAAFDELVDRFLHEYYITYPTRATNVGIHDYDATMRATSAEDLNRWTERLREFQSELREISTPSLSPERQFDSRLLDARLDAMLLELEVVQDWRRKPGYYLGLISWSTHSMLKRDFAPLGERVVHLNERLAQVPRILSDGKANLEDPPRIFVEIAISQGKGLQRFLEELVPPQVERVDDDRIREEFAEKNAVATREIDAYVAWLETDLLPVASGDYRLGEEVYSKKLLYEEMEGRPIAELLNLGKRALVETHAQMREAAAEMEPGLGIRDALARNAAKAPAPEDLLPATNRGLAQIRQFLIDMEILTMPDPALENLTVAETPIFRRSLTFASMDSPGVLEENADEAYYYVTPPNPEWDEEKQRDHMSHYNPYRLEMISIHEAYPGHYYQFLAMRQTPSLLRALFGPRTNSEGWAHYCELMMWEEGYGKDVPEYRLAQLHAALKRICRYIVGISLHTRGMTYPQAVEFFETHGLESRVNAEREARRGTSDPTYLVYTLGKWQILALREEYRRRRGSDYRLGEFHDRFLSYGRAPLPLIRQAMLEAADAAPAEEGTD